MPQNEPNVLQTIPDEWHQKDYNAMERHTILKRPPAFTWSAEYQHVIEEI
jgi:hypothetical protein